MIVESLLKNPDTIFETKNDTTAKLWLLELGLMGKFSNTSDSRTQLITHRDHPTHFIVAMFFTGKTKKSDNGYVIFCLPKSEFPPELALQFVEKISREQGYVESVKPLADQSSDN
jgi:hypothetical protein